MVRKRISLPKGSYSARSRTALDARVVNGFGEAVEDSPKAEFVLYGASGLERWVTISGGLCRGQIEAGGFLYVVSGSSLLKVTSGGAVTTLGVIPGSDPVIMARNGADPIQVAIVSDGRVYVATETTCGLLYLPEILENVVSVDWIDGYFVFAISDGRFFISQLNGTEVDALDFASAEGDPDGLERVVANGRELLMFGPKTIEVWSNTGAASFPFQRLQGAVIQHGLGARYSACRVGPAQYFVDSTGIVRRIAAGYQTERVSNFELERLIEDLGDYSGLEAFSYTAKGHEYYVLSSSEWTWVFDASTGVWHERRTGVSSRWQARSAVYFGGRFVVGSRDNPHLYRITEDRFDEDGEPLIFTVRLPVADAFPLGAIVHRLDLDIEMGVGAADALVAQPITWDLINVSLDSDKITFDQTIDHRGDLPNVAGKYPTWNPEIMLRWSDDGGRSWSQGLRQKLGHQAEVGRVSFTRLGAFGRQGRIFEVSISASVFRALIAANIDVDARRA